MRYETLASDSERLAARLGLELDSAAFVDHNGASGAPVALDDSALGDECDHLYTRLATLARERY